MRIHNIRAGHATNSSSTHSIVFLPDVEDIYVDDYDFGWQNFSAASLDSRMHYLGLIIYDTLLESLSPANASYMASQLAGVEVTGYIDHQSMYSLPQSRYGKGLDLDFLHDFREYLLQDNLVILGGNDNDSPAHPLGPGMPLLTPQLEDTSDRIVARKDGDTWVLLNTQSGGKVRMSFEDTHEYTQSTYPELVDLKITNKCTYKCTWCYQNSTPQGSHATESDILWIVDAMEAMEVLEVVVGGGEAMDHPNFLRILQRIRDGGMLPSFTTRNIEWITTGISRPILEVISGFSCSVQCINDVVALVDAIAQMGISVDSVSIQHVVGTAEEDSVAEMIRYGWTEGIQMTLLGYKYSGRGSGYTPGDVNIRRIMEGLMDDGTYPTVSIDTTLAQMMSGDLDLMGISPILYETSEGRFSTYIDVVEMKMGPSSYDTESMVSIAWGEMESCAEFTRKVVGIYQNTEVRHVEWS